MDKLLKLLEDNREEKLEIADPVEVWIDLHVADLKGSGAKGIIKFPSRQLHQLYLDWAKELNEPRYLYNQIQFMVRLANLKVQGLKTGIHTNKGKWCAFDMDVLLKN